MESASEQRLQPEVYMRRFFALLTFAALALSAGLPHVARAAAEETLTVFNNAMGGYDVEAEYADGTQKSEHILSNRTATWRATEENPIVSMIANRDPIECRVAKRPLTGSWEIIADSRKCSLKQMMHRRH